MSLLAADSNYVLPCSHVAVLQDPKVHLFALAAVLTYLCK